MLGMLTPGCHGALEDSRHTSGDLELAFPSSVFSSSSGRVMAEGINYSCRIRHENANVLKHADYQIAAGRLEKER